MITRDDWLNALKEATVPEPADEESLTIAEFAALLGVERAQASKRMRLLVKKGKAELTRRQIRRVDGGLIYVPSYRLKV
jgi:predicted transcriptional regulator